jgi:hypothetical protein
MPSSHPELPEGRPEHFRATVHGTVFAGRERLVDELRSGDRLSLRADPPGGEEEAVWVHTLQGDPVGHLPAEIAIWLAPWMRAGGVATAVAEEVGDSEVPSWRRLVVDVWCR